MRKWILGFPIVFLVCFWTVSSQAQFDPCWNCVGNWPNAVCESYQLEGYDRCLVHTSSCPGGLCCENLQSGTCKWCELDEPYEYCVMGKAAMERPEIRDVQWRQPSTDTLDRIPWITNVELPSQIRAHSIVPKFDQIVGRLQMTELTNGIGAPILYTIPLKDHTTMLVRLTTEERAQVITQFIRVYRVPDNPNAKANEPSVNSHDVVQGRNFLVEEITLEHDKWTISHPQGGETFSDKVKPYHLPLTKEQAEGICKKSQHSGL